MNNTPIKLPCGATAVFDRETMCSYRCLNCFTTIGSMGQPSRCKELQDQWHNNRKLGGKGWDYDKGEPEGDNEYD